MATVIVGHLKCRKPDVLVMSEAAAIVSWHDNATLATEISGAGIAFSFSRHLKTIQTQISSHPAQASFLLVLLFIPCRRLSALCWKTPMALCNADWGNAITAILTSDTVRGIFFVAPHHLRCFVLSAISAPAVFVAEGRDSCKSEATQVQIAFCRC